MFRRRKSIAAAAGAAVAVLAPFLALPAAAAGASDPPGGVTTNPPPYYSTISGLLSWGGVGTCSSVVSALCPPQFPGGIASLAVNLNYADNATISANEAGKHGPAATAEVLVNPVPGGTTVVPPTGGTIPASTACATTDALRTLTTSSAYSGAERQPRPTIATATTTTPLCVTVGPLAAQPNGASSMAFSISVPQITYDYTAGLQLDQPTVPCGNRSCPGVEALVGSWSQWAGYFGSTEPGTIGATSTIQQLLTAEGYSSTVSESFSGPFTENLVTVPGQSAVLTERFPTTTFIIFPSTTTGAPVAEVTYGARTLTWKWAAGSEAWTPSSGWAAVGPFSEGSTPGGTLSFMGGSEESLPVATSGSSSNSAPLEIFSGTPLASGFSVLTGQSGGGQESGSEIGQLALFTGLATVEDGTGGTPTQDQPALGTAQADIADGSNVQVQGDSGNGQTAQSGTSFASPLVTSFFAPDGFYNAADPDWTVPSGWTDTIGSEAQGTCPTEAAPPTAQSGQVVTSCVNKLSSPIGTTPGTYEVDAFDLNTGTTATSSATSDVYTLVVTPDSTTTSITAAPFSLLEGASTTLTASVTNTTLGTSATDGSVTFTDGSQALCSNVVIEKGSASCTTSDLPVGTDTVAASYQGGSYEAPSSGTTIVTVTSPPAEKTTTSLTADPSSITAGSSTTLTSATNAGTQSVSTGTVTFSYNDSVLCSGVKVDAEGEASCSTSDLPVGTDTVTAAYSGATGLRPSSATTTVSVASPPPPQKTPTETKVTASPGKAAPGKAVTLTATVTANGHLVSSGHVIFIDRTTGEVLCSDVTVSSTGSAICRTSDLPVGTPEVIADFTPTLKNELPSNGQTTVTVTPPTHSTTPPSKKHPGSHPAPKPTPNPVVPPGHTGEPWYGWLWWASMASIFVMAGVILVAAFKFAGSESRDTTKAD